MKLQDLVFKNNLSTVEHNGRVLRITANDDLTYSARLIDSFRTTLWENLIASELQDILDSFFHEAEQSTHSAPQTPEEGLNLSQSAQSTQVGGNHYSKLAIQPMRYSMANGLDPLQHTIIKYVTRFRDKGGIEDLDKAKHCIDMLIEHEQSIESA